MKEKKTVREKIEACIGVVPAIAIVLCVSLALSGYSEPTYSVDDAANKTKETLKGTAKKLAVNLPKEKAARKISEIDEPGQYKDGTYYGSAKGYNGLVKVEVVIKKEKISSAKVVSHSDDQPYFQNAEKAILPAIVKGQTTNVDAVSGATFSSNGIIKAVRNALAKAAVKKNKNTATEDEETVENDAEPEDKEIEGGIEQPTDYTYKDGTYNNDKKMILCENPKDSSWAYYLSVNVTITDGKITAVKESKKVGKSGTYNVSNDTYLKRAFNGLGSRKGIEAKIVESQSTTGIDAVTGATYSSQAIVASVNTILPTVEKIPVVKPEEPTGEVAEEPTDETKVIENDPASETEEGKDDTTTEINSGDENTPADESTQNSNKVEAVILSNDPEDDLE